MVQGTEAGPPIRGARLRLSASFWRRPWLKGTSLLAPPVLAFLCIYVASLAVLLLSGFWTADPFTGKTVHHWTLDNFRRLFSTSDTTYWQIIGRTVLIAAAVTVTDAILALPLGFYMARVAAPRTRAALFVMVLLPLWASYLVRIYSWTTILSKDGVLNWTLNGVGLPDAHIAYTNWAMWIVFSYIWLPFMVLPVFAAFERIPESYLEASRDLGARGVRTFRSVIFPLALPGIVAGSIFTFSLTLGDYITPELIGGPSSSFIGNVIDQRHGDNIPFAAALASVPLMIMAVYLALAKRLGAFEAL
ncbi:MAG: spermidine/putrescine ABC transporter permease [Candidatus Rokuibacteriota bacterium]|nr:MAG: spermidine/putrescine ABC transporter permease [Candidatus Rokubacteria bacterium]